jgi:hypothetical protein
MPSTSPRLRSLLRLLLVVTAVTAGAVGLAACAGGAPAAEVAVRYDPGQDSTTYRAGPVQMEPSRDALQQTSPGSVTGQGRRGRATRQRQQRARQNRPRFQVSAVARCDGESCTPTEVDVTFRVDRARVRRGGPLSLTMGGQTLEWASTRVAAPLAGRSEDVVGTVTLSWTQFQAFARSRIVEGRMSRVDFESEYDDRAPLRRLVDRAGLSIDTAGGSE